MYSRTVRNNINCGYSVIKSNLAKLFRFQFPHDFTKPVNRVRFPGPNHLRAMEEAQSTVSLILIAC